MSYIKNDWISNVTIVSANKMNNIEKGIKEAYDNLSDKASVSETYTTSQVDAKLSVVNFNKLDDVVFVNSHLNFYAGGVLKASIKLNTDDMDGEGDSEALNRYEEAYKHSILPHAPSNAQKNIQSDWNETDSISDAYIKNKPDISKLATIEFVNHQIELHNHDNLYASKNSEHTHDNRDILDSITQENIDAWNSGTGGGEGSVSPDHKHNAEDISYSNKAYPTITNLKEALDRLLYFDLTISFSSNIGSVVEIGSTVRGPVFNWSYNKSITSQSFNNIDLDVNLRTYSPNDVLTSAKSYTLRASDGVNSYSRSYGINFYNGVYYGSSGSIEYDSALIKSLKKELSNTRKRTITVDCKDLEYIYYCYPASYGQPTFTVGSFQGGFLKVNTISFTNNSGYTENYDIWRSANHSLAVTTIVIT